MQALAVVVAWVEPLAHRARTPHRWSVALAGPAATRARRVRVRRVSAAWMELKAAAMAAPVVLAALAEREPIAAPVGPAALVLLDRAPVVVLVLRAPAARVAVAAWAALASMRAVLPMVPLVVMPELAALVAWVELRARRASTPRP
jgi:hypothetical protein